MKKNKFYCADEEEEWEPNGGTDEELQEAEEWGEEWAEVEQEHEGEGERSE